jgi:hypothetical protein
MRTEQWAAYFYSVVDRIRDPESGAFLTPGSGMGKKQDLDPGSGSGMNNPEHISGSLETFFGFKYLNSLMRIRDPGWQKFVSGIRDGKNSDLGWQKSDPG